MENRYVGSRDIYNSIIDFEIKSASGLNGFILLMHIGTDPRRKDKFYLMLEQLIDELSRKGYQLVRIDDLLGK
jgi:endoglucanase